MKKIELKFDKDSKLTDTDKEGLQVIADALNAEIEKMSANQITKEELTAKVNEIVKDSNVDGTKLTELETALKAQGLELTALKEKGIDTPEKDLKSILIEGLKGFNEGKTDKVKLDIPVKTILPASFTTNYAGARIPGFGQAATIKRRIADLFSQFPIGADSNGVIYYTDQTTTTRNAASRAVGDAAGTSVLAWTGYSASLQCISDSIPIAKEMLTRYSLMEAEIRNFIMNNLLLKEDADLVTGSGNAPDIKGIYTYATAFNSSTYTGFKPTKAGLMDLMVVMATEIMKSTQYNVDTVIVNPADALGLVLEKDANGNRINFQMINQVSGEMMVKNIRVIESASQTINTLTIGDFTKARRYYGENINLEFGYNASGDFTKRIVTLLGNIEELLLVRNVEADAFLKSTDLLGDIANITALTT